MFKAISPGTILQIKKKISETETASSLGSGSLDVYSTPSMIAFMENTAMRSVQRNLPDGYGTVGIMICVKHIKAVLPGAEIECRSTLLRTEDKKLHFRVEVFHGTELVGSGDHDRYIIEENKFLEKIIKNAY